MRYRRLRDLREDHDLKQINVASMLNMSQTGYSKYETGENDIPTHILIQLADFYHVSIDYLLKPIKESDLRRAVEKLEHLTRAGMGEYSRRIGELVRSQRGAQAFLVYVKDRIIPLKTEDIAYLYSSNEKVAVCTLKGEHFPFDRTLDAVMAQLPEEGFFRANRQFVISREAIADISVWFGNRLSVNLSVEVPEKVVISKARVPEFKRWISGIR